MTEQQRAPEQIEQEISATRANIDHTLDAIQEKLSPGHLLDRSLGLVKDGGGTFAANVGRAARDNPVPAILVGAGLIWLAVSASSKTSNRDRSAGTAQDERATARSAGNPSTRPCSADAPSPRPVSGEAPGPAARKPAGDSTPSPGQSDSSPGQKVAGAVSGARERIGELTGSAREKTGAMVDSAQRKAGRAKERAGQFVQEYPLVVGALGLALGAAIAAALPPTRREDDLMGETADGLKRAARETVDQTARQATEVAKGAVEGAKQAARDSQSGSAPGSDDDAPPAGASKPGDAEKSTPGTQTQDNGTAGKSVPRA